jgi:hypothetical protein
MSDIGDLASEFAALKLENERLKAGGCARDQRATQFCGQAVAMGKRIKELEARIDWLMLEYCPEEMTEEQKQRWADSQEPAGGKSDG